MGGERRAKAEKEDWPPTPNFEEWCAKHKLCTRCGGGGDCCRGCSGFAGDYPELFGSCGNIVTCPECLGSGNAEDQIPGRKVEMQLVEA